MPKPSSLSNSPAAFIGGALVLSSALYVYMILGALGFVRTPYTCLTDVLGQTSDPAGHFFEVSESSCSGVGKGPAYISVFASKAKGQRKSLIFKYEAMHDGSRDAEPVIETRGNDRLSQQTLGYLSNRIRHRSHRRRGLRWS